MGRARGPGEVRLPRPEDADGAGNAPCDCCARRGIEIDLLRICRSTMRRPTRCWRAARRSACSRWKAPGMRARAGRHAARPLRGHHRARRALPARPDGQYPDLLRAQARRGADRLYLHPKLEPILRETFGVIIYQEQVMQIAQLLAGYSLGEADLLRRAMGKKIQHGDGRAARALSSRGAIERGIAQARRRRDLRRLREVRRLRLQQDPRGGLCAARLSDRLYEGELSGRVPRRVDDARHGQHRQARRIPRRGASGSASRSSRPRSTAPGVEFDVDGNAIHYALAALKGVGRQAVETIVAARGERPFARPRRFRRPRQSARASTSACWKAWPPPALSMASSANRARAFAAVDVDAGDGAAHPRKRGSRPVRTVRRPGRARTADACPTRRAVAAGRAAAARIRRDRLFSLRPPARRLCGGAQAAAGAVLGRFFPRREGGRQRRPRRRHGGGAHRAAHQAPATRWASSACPIPSGHYEAVLFAEGLGAVSRSARAGHAPCCCSSPPRFRATKCARASSRSSRSMRRQRRCRRACASSCATKRRSTAWRGASNRRRAGKLQ